jgi:hypothetical protein
MCVEGFAVFVFAPLPAGAVWTCSDQTANLCGEASSGGVNSSGGVCKITASENFSVTDNFHSLLPVPMVHAARPV